MANLEATAYPEASRFSIERPCSPHRQNRLTILAISGLYSLVSAAAADGFVPTNSHAPDRTKQMENPFMARAIQLSLDNVVSGQGGPFGAVIVKNGVVIAEGENRVTSTNDPTAHAEVVSIRAACAKLGGFELRDCEIYTSCEPCPMCMGAIYWSRIARVYFGNLAADASQIGFDDSFIYSELAQPFSQRSVPMVPMMREQALAAFRAWQEKSNKVPY